VSTIFFTLEDGDFVCRRFITEKFFVRSLYNKRHDTTVGIDKLEQRMEIIQKPREMVKE